MNGDYALVTLAKPASSSSFRMPSRQAEWKFLVNDPSNRLPCLNSNWHKVNEKIDMTQIE